MASGPSAAQVHVVFRNLKQKNLVQCNICLQKVKTSGNTSNQRYHLKKHHSHHLKNSNRLNFGVPSSSRSRGDRSSNDVEVIEASNEDEMREIVENPQTEPEESVSVPSSTSTNSNSLLDYGYTTESSSWTSSSVPNRSHLGSETFESHSIDLNSYALSSPSTASTSANASCSFNTSLMGAKTASDNRQLQQHKRSICEC